jgi:outer membrane protein TolC
VLDLETAKRIALADSPSLVAAGDRFRQAQERVRQANSAYWPRLDASGSGSRIVLSENDYQANLAKAIPNIQVDDTETYYRAGLTASWILYNGFERKFAKMSSQYGEQGSLEAIKDAQRLLLSSISSRGES